MDLLTEYKIEYAFTTNSGINEKTQNKLEIKRIGVNASDSIYLFVFKLFVNSLR